MMAALRLRVQQCGQFIQPWMSKLDAMSVRKRALIFATSVALLFALLDSMVLSPMMAKEQRLLAEVDIASQGMAVVQMQMQVLMQSAKLSPEESARLLFLRQALQSNERKLSASRSSLVEPRDMPALLEKVLSQNHSVRLQSLQTLMVEPLLSGGDAKKAKGGQAAPMMYRHGVVLTVRGSYLDLLRYVLALEALPTQMYWGAMRLRILTYPTSELTLTLYTLSRDMTWMQL